MEKEKKAKRKIRFPIIFKTIVMIFVFGLILAETAMVYFSLVSSNNNKENYKRIATDLSYTVAYSLDKDDVTIVKNAIVGYYNACDPKPTRDQEGTDSYNEYMANIELVKQTSEYQNLQSVLHYLNSINRDCEGIYLGYVDYDLKLCVYLVYDQENELYPTGIVDPLYEEDYPLIDDHGLGFVASIYQSEQGEYLVTAGAPIYLTYDSEGKGVGEPICYALVDISMHMVRARQVESIIRLFIYLMSTVVIISILGIIVVSFTLIKPVKILEKATKSYDINDPSGTHEVFSNLRVNVHDEFSDLAESMKKMESDINNKINELSKINADLVAAHNETKRMSELANKDGLTGVKNKIAYDNAVEDLDKKILNKEIKEFGIVMVDLNCLKNINDEYGHQNGDIAIISLCNIICGTFAHSPVYRIGGDEFVVILKDSDYKNIDSLVSDFNKRLEIIAKDDSLTPAEKVSGALGYSLFTNKDKCVEDVFKRADKAMYARKKEMKLANKNN